MRNKSSRLLSDETLNTLLSQIHEVGLYEFSLEIQTEERTSEEGGNVFYLVGTLSYEDGDETIIGEPERIATFYQSQSQEPTYNAEAVVGYIKSMAEVFPLLVVNLMDTSDYTTSLERQVTAARGMLRMLYMAASTITDDASVFAKALKPLAGVLGVDDLSGFNKFLDSIPDGDDGDESNV